MRSLTIRNMAAIFIAASILLIAVFQALPEDRAVTVEDQVASLGVGSLLEEGQYADTADASAEHGYRRLGQAGIELMAGAIGIVTAFGCGMWIRERFFR